MACRALNSASTAVYELGVGKLSLRFHVNMNDNVNVNDNVVHVHVADVQTCEVEFTSDHYITL